MSHYYPNTENTAGCPIVADTTSHYTLGGLNTITIPPIAAEGDLLLFITGADGATEATGTTWTAPAGTSAAPNFPYLAGSGWAPYINVWFKAASASDGGAQYTFGKTGSGAQTSFALVIQNFGSLTNGAFGFNGTALNGNPGTIAQASTTFTACGLSIIMGFAQNDQQLVPVPEQPTYSQVEQTYPAYRGGSLGIRVFNGAGSTGVRTWDIGTVGNNAFSVAEVVVY